MDIIVIALIVLFVLGLISIVGALRRIARATEETAKLLRGMSASNALPVASEEVEDHLIP
jgi:Sec-independent protein translocase protein TatA